MFDQDGDTSLGRLVRQAKSSEKAHANAAHLGVWIPDDSKHGVD